MPFGIDGRKLKALTKTALRKAFVHHVLSTRGMRGAAQGYIGREGLAPRLGIVRVNTQDMLVDERDSLALRTHPYEPFETELVRRTVQPGRVALDIGANIGYYTLLFAELVGPRGSVLAFEPDPSNFGILRDNLRLNRCRQVRAEQMAVSNVDGTQKLFLATESAGDHRLFDFWKDRRSIEVAATRLDSYLAARPSALDYIKIDIQGAELLALEGMAETIRANPTLMMFTEYSPRLLAEIGATPTDYLRQLSNHGFDFYEICERDRALRRTDEGALASRFEAEARLAGDAYTNLLCARSPLSPALEELIQPL